MRHVVILVVVLFASSIVGQEEPLPLVALAVEPAVDLPPPTLADAARANDYATFAALYEKTKDAAYAPLHELWTYSVTDPVGAFYGAERYAALARAYPSFAAYIDEYKIVDMRGNVFYPTSETRRFLLARALDGVQVVVPKVEVARREAPPVRPAEVVPAGSRRTGRQDAGAPAVTAPAGTAPAGTAPAGTAPAGTAPAVSAPAPVAAVVAEQAPAPVTAVVPVAPILAPPPAPPARQNSLAGRGLLLVIFGLIGIGLLALIMRTPGEPTVVRPRRDP